jgi:hypothetical protein
MNSKLKLVLLTVLVVALALLMAKACVNGHDLFGMFDGSER